MDSIFRNYPIGVSLIWVAPFRKTMHIRPNNNSIIPPYNKKAKFADLVIDGQQRLSSIYGVLYGVETDIQPNFTINFKELFFNCDKHAEKRFVFSKKFSDMESKGYISLTTLLNTPPAVLNKRFALCKWESKEATKCYEAFYKYKFQFIQFEGHSEDEIREIFIRINSAGMTISRADTLFAKATDVKLREHMMVDVRRGLKNGFDLISPDALQNSLVLAYGAKQLGLKGVETFLNKIDSNKKGNKEFEKIWKKLQYGYEEAVDFLVNSLKVPNCKLLPSQNVYSMLAYFFFLNQARANTHQIREIKKWFWHTVCGERYSGSAFNRNIPLDIGFFQRLATNSHARYHIEEKINPIDFLITQYNSSKSSSAIAYFIMLRNRNPQYLINGEDMLLDNASSISNRKDKHHIFPSALLGRKKVSVKMRNSIVNICYLESDENESFGDKQPRIYLQPYEREKHFERVMKGHLIPYDSESPIWWKNVKEAFLGFFNIRSKLIIEEIEKLAGNTKIFEKYEDLKRI